MSEFILEALLLLILLGGGVTAAALFLLARKFWTGEAYDWHQEGRDNG